MPQPPAHAEHREHAEQRGCHRADPDERIHIRRTVQEIAESVDIVWTIHIHDRKNEHELRECERQRILRAPKNLLESRCIGYTPHREHRAHRKIHRRQEEEDGREKPRPHGTRRPLCSIHPRIRCAATLRGCLCAPRALDARAVPRVLDHGNDRGGACDCCIIGERHRIRQEIDGDLRRPFHLLYGAFHPRRTRRAGHARHVECFFLHGYSFYCQKASFLTSAPIASQARHLLTCPRSKPEGCS